MRASKQFATLAIFTALASGGSYTIQDLGSLGGLTSDARAVNDAGQVTGSSRAGTYDHAYLWDPVTKSMLDLGTLGGTQIYGNAINSTGNVVGSSSTASSIFDHAFLWHATSKMMRDLGTLGGLTSDALGINDAGFIVGTSSTVDTAPTHPFLWNPVTQKMQDLGTLGGLSAEANSVNNTGHVAGWAADVAGNSKAFLWDGATMKSLGTLGGNYSIGQGISNNDNVTGYSEVTVGRSHAFLWQGAGMLDLGVLPGESLSTGAAVNNAGQVVGWSYNDSFDHSAFLWDGTQMLDLNNLLVNGSGWELKQAFGINASGQIVGSGLLEGVYRGFLLTPTNVATGPPQPKAVKPATPSGGARQTFTFTFSSAGGFQTLNLVDILINNVLDGRQACYMAFAPSGPNAGAVYLVDDAGDAAGPYAGMLLPGAGTVQNNQCTIAASTSSVSGSGTTLTLILDMAFASSFGGNKVIYLSAQDSANNNSGWQALGTWGVPEPNPSGPSVSRTFPARSNSATINSYLFDFSDTNGIQDLSVLNVLVNDSIDGRHGCYVAFVPSGANSGALYLVDDAGDAAGPYSGMVLPGSGTVQNSQCTIHATGSSVLDSGNFVSLTLAIDFNHSFAGNRIMYLAARSNTLNSSWQAVKSVSVP